AIAFATAVGGLSKSAVNAMRVEQRNWLDFAAKSCTDDAQLLPDTARFDAEQVDCLTQAVTARMTVLEQSRMLGGHRFAVSSLYNTLPDPDAVENPDSFWKVATHQLSYPVLDGADAAAAGFNAFVDARAESASGSIIEGETVMNNGQIDTSVDMTLAEVTGSRVTLKVMTIWFGHGAAHPNWGISYAHYLLDRNRALLASDIFAGDGWEQKLTDLATAELKREHGDNLQLEDDADLTPSVTDPERWNFANDAGLTIQFEPYEVSAYAYGAPTIVVPWDSLGDIMAEGADAIRYGF
ncbi:MAG TPA: RsiV family protein, partial [Devosia sp.]|nr:RsiV family protein [Devosia sp.]